MSAVVIGVGSNLGAREASIRTASALLDARDGIEVTAVSKIRETDPLGPPQPRYLNAAFRLETSLSPRQLLRVLLRTERRLGRRRVPDERWGPRSIDLDYLWDERGSHDSPGLLVPHRELQNRNFALGPLLDVMPALAEAFGPSLARLGGAPALWTREALVNVEQRSNSFEIEVEADSLADACALCLARDEADGRPWSSRHFTIEPSAEQFLRAVRETLHTGFLIHRATISHCSQSQWALEFHGVSLGNPTPTDVRLQTTSGRERSNRAHLAVVFNP